MDKKTAHYFQHVPFENLGIMESWLQSHGYSITSTGFFRDDPLPDVNALDWLIIMGGPMGVYDYDTCPWLYEEKRCIEEALNKGKVIIGVCLGAQLIAEVLGAQITQNKHREIGWFPIERETDAAKIPLVSHLPKILPVFHWHSDTFDIPTGATRFASNQACMNQGFLYSDRVIGLQFHMESTRENVRLLAENCKNEIVDGTYIQTADEMLSHDEYYMTMNKIFKKILEKLDNVA